LWFYEPENYFEYKAGYDVYMKTVEKEFARLNSARKKLRFWDRSFSNSRKYQIVFDCSTFLTTLTPPLHHALTAQNYQVKYLILLRNPLQTIHSLYVAESERHFVKRPRSFWTDGNPANVDLDPMIASANFWKNTYKLIDELRHRYDPDNFLEVQLHDFTWNQTYLQAVCKFLDVPLDIDKWTAFRDSVMHEPKRKAYNHESIRNSHLYHDPNFAFSDAQMQAILQNISDVMAIYNLDAEQCIEEYRATRKK
jgi:hypothetical protein